MEQVPVEGAFGVRGKLNWECAAGEFRFRCRIAPSGQIDRLYLMGNPPLRLGIPAPDADGMLTLEGALPLSRLADVPMPPRAVCASDAAAACRIGEPSVPMEPVLRNLLQTAQRNALRITRDAVSLTVEEPLHPGQALTLAAVFPLLEVAPGVLRLRIDENGWPVSSIPQNSAEEKSL